MRGKVLKVFLHLCEIKIWRRHLKILINVKRELRAVQDRKTLQVCWNFQKIKFCTWKIFEIQFEEIFIFVKLPTPPLCFLYLHINFISFPHWISMMNLLIFPRRKPINIPKTTTKQHKKCQMVQLLWRKVTYLFFYIYISLFRKQQRYIFIIIISHADRQTTIFKKNFFSILILVIIIVRGHRKFVTVLFQLGACIYLFTYKKVENEKNLFFFVGMFINEVQYFMDGWGVRF